MTYKFDIPEEDDPYNLLGGMRSGIDMSEIYATADRPEDQVIEAPTADPFTQGRAATSTKTDPYSARGQLLRSQASAVSADAMATLERALKNQQHVTAEQGIAAALLAVIPTIGGGIIGRSVGRSKLPEGTFGVGKLAPTGFSAGAQAGLEGGLKAADSYLDSFKPSKEQQEALLRMAEYKNREAQTLRTEANQAEMAGLNQQQISERQQNYLDLQRELAQGRIANRAAPRPTENEATAAAMASLKQTNPVLFQKVAKKEALTDEDRLQLPPELVPFVMNSVPKQNGGSYFDNFSAAQQDSIRKSKFAIDEARSIASDLEKSGYSWAKFQTMRGLSAADTEGIGLRLKYLADSLARARSGAALNKEEVKLYNRMVAGDASVPPAQVAKLLRVLSDTEARSVMAFEPLMTATDKQSFFANFAPGQAIPNPSTGLSDKEKELAELKAVLARVKGVK